VRCRRRVLRVEGVRGDVVEGEEEGFWRRCVKAWWLEGVSNVTKLDVKDSPFVVSTAAERY
jgi:hypothetical protein